MNNTHNYLGMMFNQLNNLKHDFEIKKFTIGLASIVQTDPTNIPQTVQQNY